MQFAICKGCEILLRTTFILPYNILRQFGTGALSWNTHPKLTWLRHKKFQNSFACIKLVHAYKQHLTGLAEPIKLCLCSGSPQSPSVSVILCEWCRLLYKIKGQQRWHTKYLKASILLAVLFCWKRKPLQPSLLPSAWEIDITVFTLTMSDRSYRHCSTLNFLFRFHW